MSLSEIQELENSYFHYRAIYLSFKCQKNVQTKPKYIQFTVKLFDKENIDVQQMFQN